MPIMNENNGIGGSLITKLCFQSRQAADLSQVEILARNDALSSLVK